MMGKKAFDIFKKYVNKIETENKPKNILVALCGGKSVVSFYKEIGLRTEEIPFKKIRFFLIDERFDSTQRNLDLIKEQIIRNMNKEIAKQIKKNFFEIKGKTLEEATMNYKKKLLEFDTKMVFDILIVGVGEDGHIASLFPNHKLLNDTQKGFGFLNNSPKPPPERITLLPQSILESKKTILFFVGESKRKAYEKFKKDGDWKSCPARLIKKIEYTIITNLE